MDTIKIFIELHEQKYSFCLDKSKINTVKDIESLIKPNLKGDNVYFTMTNPTVKILSDRNIPQLVEENELHIKANYKLKGGLGIAMFAVLIFPMIFIGKAFVRLGDVMEKFFSLFEDVALMIPVIFDPNRLIDDILYAVTFGINKVFTSASESAGGMASSPEDETEGSGPFDIDEKTPSKCIDPTFTTILLLILCPPLAILLKLGFLAGFVSSIICGVLCVKLYYFPGLLFAILHVLC